ncbi:alpha/beta-hydrolase [Lentinus tigrinus ALCF2SS1-7]|uniref:Alpha/beta-hydrolase n=1 Tax=Lentinus tigrinus ALCF2SS1-6 TaxID=1328759 RepID=A0A5C2RN27_9APHY|nr:alpha/beta-hydrolase [Lentinus tigrinus ALCF2SS1-6]RPD79481.1 alpha/beta-hydrolase [Lentinus tigrinus ALCF2SS1-7]
MPTIGVDDNGTELAYLDSGAPSARPDSYVTIFAIHGTVFGFHIYDKIFRLLQDRSDIRFVAISRRGYPGSTPFTPDEITALSTDSDDQKEAFLRARGTEVALFIDKFIEKFDLPPISSDGSSGGIALMGWSLGCSVALSVVSHMDTYPQRVQDRLGAHLRTLILHDPPQVALGLPPAPQSWNPHYDTSITPAQALQATVRWLTSYMRHGDLSTRSLDALEWVVPATFRAPSIYTMSDAEVAQIVAYDQAGPDATWFMTCGPQLRASYEKACFDPAVRAKVPRMAVWVLIGDVTLPFGIAATWQVEADNVAMGGGDSVSVKRIPGTNHFMQWDDPSLALQAFKEVIA